MKKGLTVLVMVAIWYAFKLYAEAHPTTPKGKIYELPQVVLPIVKRISL